MLNFKLGQILFLFFRTRVHLLSHYHELATMLSMLRRRCVGGVSAVSSIITISKNTNKLFPRRPYTCDPFIDMPPLPRPPCYYKCVKETIAYINSATRDFDDMLSRGYSTISDYNALFSSLLNIHQHSTVLRLAKQFESQDPNLHPVTPDINTWLILISCHAKNGHISSAFSLFRKIINAGHRPSSSDMYDLFCCLLAPGHIYKAMLLHNYIFLKGGFRLSCKLIII